MVNEKPDYKLNWANKANLTKIIQPDDSWTPRIYNYILVCPICRNENVHLIGLKCLRETDETVVTFEGTLVRKTANDQRGAKGTLQYSCENGHVGEILLQFYKGRTYLDHNILPKEIDQTDIWVD